MNTENLTVIDLSDEVITDEMIIPVISKFQLTLKSIDLSYTRITDRTVRVILECSNVSYLNLTHCEDISPKTEQKFRKIDSDLEFFEVLTGY